MSHILLFLIALLPGMAWLALACLASRSGPEFRRRLVRLFFLGMVVCIPAGYFNPLLQGSLIGKTGIERFSDPIFFFLIVGPVEETLKYLIVRSERRRKAQVASIREGVLLATAAALGFATYENMHYMEMLGIQVIFTRGWLTCVLHAVCSAFFGYSAGYARTHGLRENVVVLEGLALAAFFHGLYNTLAGQESQAMYGLVACLCAAYAALCVAQWRPVLSMLLGDRLNLPSELEPGGFPAVPAFGEVTSTAARREVRDVLSALGDVDEETRLEAIRYGETMRDDRVFKAVRELLHDPSPAVRALASVVYARMRAELAGRDQETE